MTRWRTRSLLVVVCFSSLIAAIPAWAAAEQAAQATAAVALPKGVERVTSVEGITEYRLANGLQVLLFPDPSKPTITVNVTYLVGSRARELRRDRHGAPARAPGVQGHAAGIPNIPQELTEHGARPNGTTWSDRTNYFETFAATDENLELGARSRGRPDGQLVHRQEGSRQRDDRRPQRVRDRARTARSACCCERVMSTAYLWHNYGKSTIGARVDIENVPIDRLQAFYQTLLPARQRGAARRRQVRRAEDARARSTSTSAPIPKPTRTLPNASTPPSRRRTASARSRCAASATCSASCRRLPRAVGRAPGLRRHRHPRRRSSATRRRAGCTRRWSRRRRRASIVRRQLPVARPGDRAASPRRCAQDASLDAARDALLQTVEGVGATPPTKEEVERARAQLLKQHRAEPELAPTGSACTMSEWIGAGDWRLLFLHRDRLRKVTADDVAGAWRPSTSSRRTARSACSSRPRSPTAPRFRRRPDVVAMLKDYKGDAAVAAGEAFDPSPANIESRTHAERHAGGLKLALLPKKTRGGTVVAQLTLRFGDEKSLMNRSDRGAARRRDADARHDEAHAPADSGRVRPAEGARQRRRRRDPGHGARSRPRARTCPAVLRLVAEVLREPAFPAERVRAAEAAAAGRLEQQKSEPTQIALRPRSAATSARTRRATSATRGPPDEADRRRQRRDARRRRSSFYRDFYGASNGELAVVGRLRPEGDRRARRRAVRHAGRAPRPFTRVPTRLHGRRADRTSRSRRRTRRTRSSSPAST